MDMEQTIGERDAEELRRLIDIEREAREAGLKDPMAGLAPQILGGGEPEKNTPRTVQIPSVCRMVHYVAYGTPGGEFPAGAHRAAIITEVDQPDPKTFEGPVTTIDQRVGLCVLNPTGLFFNRHIPYDGETHAPGTWHWPEAVFGAR